MIDPERIQPYPDLKPLDLLTAFVSGTSPAAVLVLDNNFDIALNLLQPRTIDELRENGIPVLESQRVLLKVWSGIKQLDEDKYQFAWPIMVGEKLNAVRTKAKEIARTILQENQSNIQFFLKVAQEESFLAHQFPLLASLVLDGMVWDQLQELGVVDNIDFSSMETGSSFWKGLAWITYPEKSFRLGTNGFARGEYGFSQSWTPQSLPLQKPIMKSAVLQQKLVDFVDNPKSYIRDKDHDQLAKMGFFEEDQLTIPYLHQEHTLWLAGKKLAAQVTSVLRDEIAKIDLELMIGMEFKGALIIFYHEIYPAMLEHLIGMGIELPGVMQGDVDAPIANSFFITKY